MNLKNKLEKININSDLILPTSAITLSILLILNPFYGTTDINKFDRTLGQGILQGVDITRRVSNMIFFDFILVPIILVLIYFLISKLCGYAKKSDSEAIKFINILSSISFVPIIFAHINKFSGKYFLGIEVVFPVCLIVLGIIFISIKNRGARIKFDTFKWCIFATIPLEFLAILFLYKFNMLNYKFDSSIIKYAIKSGIIISLFLILFTIIFFIITKLYDKINFIALKKAYTLIVCTPIIISLFLEITNILNQYSIFINSKFKISVIIYFIAFILACLVYSKIKSCSKIGNNFNFEKYYYPLILISFAFINVQLSLQNTIKTDFFEQSNHGTAINELFMYGKLPIFETFDAHMIGNQIGNIIYGVLNNDFRGAVFLGYSLVPIFIILYYYLLSKFFNRDVSLFLLLVFPIMSDPIYVLFSLLPLVACSFLYAYKSKNYKGYSLFWLSIAVTCAYRLDMGFALIFATIVTWTILWFYEKDSVLIKKLVLSGIYLMISALFIFILICLLKDISPLKRLVEFLKLCLSNVNWAHSSLGDRKTNAYTICYFIIPAIAMIMLIVLILKKYLKTEFITNDKFIILLIIGLVYVFNFQRGIIRHSLSEGKYTTIISSAIIFISMAIYIFDKKKRLITFIASYTTLTIILGMTINLESVFPRPLITTALDKYMAFEPYKSLSTEKKDRVVISDEMKEVYIPLKEVLDKTLLPDETYIDFTNQTLLYALTEREKPVYINQSPGLLSGEYTQQLFIDECEKKSDKVPFVIMPVDLSLNLSSTLDSIRNTYRYYLVSEYIGNNFKPLFKNSKFAVWCRNDRYDEKYNKLIKLSATQGNSNKIKINENCYNVLNARNENLTIENNELLLKSTNKDPILMGLENLIKLDNIQLNTKYVNINIEYESNKEGLFEVFYTMEKNENFAQKKVVSKYMDKNGILKAKIPYTKFTKIRFDIPEDSTVKIKNISFDEIDNEYQDEIEKIDYNYMQLDYHLNHLANIPYIWANYDKIGIEEKEEQLILNQNCNMYDFSSIDKQNGNYLYVNASSDKEGTMTIQFGKENENGFNALSQFDFSLKKGKNQKYLIRISSDFMWYSNEINAIKITSDNNATIDKTSILKGDTLK